MRRNGARCSNRFLAIACLLSAESVLGLVQYEVSRDEVWLSADTSERWDLRVGPHGIMRRSLREWNSDGVVRWMILDPFESEWPLCLVEKRPRDGAVSVVLDLLGVRRSEEMEFYQLATETETHGSVQWRRYVRVRE